ncbi:MAG TPA: hypothetical protein VHW72_15975 [Candidatus Angelobacter sp.]|jgi:hypothetical protein|nr:hypothetical protein [Candidatus Angelobacter sp.]
MSANSIQNLARVVDRCLKSFDVLSPGIRALTRLFETLFFATLKTEEGKPLQFRIVLVDPANPDPDAPPRPRPHRWKITTLGRQLPLTVPTLVKLSKAADPWNSSLAAYYNPKGEFFVWGLVDQSVQFNTMLVRETESGYGLPGLFQILAAGPADLSVHVDFRFIARLQQDTVLKSQTDIFWSAGPISDCIDLPMQRYLENIWSKSGRPDKESEQWKGQVPYLANEWIRTLCRILISIQRYRHGGALLLTTGKAHLDVKYEIRYERIPEALRNLGVARIKQNRAQEELRRYLDDPTIDVVPAMVHLDESIEETAVEDYTNEITGCVRFVSSLSYVDGLILSNPDLSIRGFGVEIRAKKDPAQVFLSTYPSGKQKSLRALNPQYYGMRHRSMMRYCFAHAGSVGFVISQDGEIRVMTRVKQALLLWENLKVLDFTKEDFRKRILKPEN